MRDLKKASEAKKCNIKKVSADTLAAQLAGSNCKGLIAAMTSAGSSTATYVCTVIVTPAHAQHTHVRACVRAV